MAKNKRGRDEDETATPAGFGHENGDVNIDGWHNRPQRSPTRGAMETSKEVEELSALPSRVLRSFDRVRAGKPGREPSEREWKKLAEAQSAGPTIEEVLDETPAVNDARVYKAFVDRLAKSKAQLRKRLGL